MVQACWTSVSPSGYDKEKEWARLAIENSWMKVTNVKFTFWKTCPTTGSSLYLKMNIGNGASSQTEAAGANNLSKASDPESPLNAGILFGFGSPGSFSRTHIEYSVVHEFGHVMGYEHEQDQDAGWNDPINAANPQSNCHPFGSWDGGVFYKGSWDDAGNYVPAPWPDDLLTAYDPDSVMNYCHTDRELSGRLSLLDITGVQLDYGLPTRTNSKGQLDADGDQIPDRTDNCPYVQNAIQDDSDFDAVLATHAGDDGHVPTGSDPQSYVDYWHTTYAGDACDPIAVPETSPSYALTQLETHTGCWVKDLGGSTPPTYDPSRVCKVGVNTNLNLEGHVGGPSGMSASRITTSTPGDPLAGSVFCRCDLEGSIGVSGCTAASKGNCLVAQDGAWPFPTPSVSSGYQEIRTECPSCPPGLHFPVMNPDYTSFINPMPIYDSAWRSTLWDMVEDLTTFGHAPTDTDILGVGWTHTGSFAYSILSMPSTLNVQNNYWPLDAKWDATYYTFHSPSFKTKWLPVPYCDPTPRVMLNGEQYMAVVSVGGTLTVATQGPGSNGLAEGIASFTTNGQTLLGTITGGNELLVAADRMGGTPRGFTGYNAIVVNAGTTRVAGAMRASPDRRIDGVLATTVVGSTAQVPLRTYSAGNQALYSLAQSGNAWQLTTRLVANALAGNATTTTVNVTGLTLTAPQAAAYDGGTDSIMVLDWTASTARLISITSAGAASLLWSTATIGGNVPTFTLATAPDGDVLISASVGGIVDLLIANTAGRPLGSYRITGSLNSAAVTDGRNISVPLNQTAGGTTPDMAPAYLTKSAFGFGVCNSSFWKTYANASVGTGTLNDGPLCP